MKTNKELKQFMNSKDFILSVLGFVEEYIGDSFKAERRFVPGTRNLYELTQHIEGGMGQQTVWLTIKFAYPFELSIVHVLRENGFSVVSKSEFENMGCEDKKADFGVRVLENDQEKIIYYEVKTTQCDNGWSGATHSMGAGKVNNFVLISYKLDKHLPFPKLSDKESAFHGVIKKVHASVIEADKCGFQWSGKATKKNSFTTSRIPVEKVGVYEKQILLGAIYPRQRWCKTARESLENYRVGGIISANLKAA